MKPNEPNVISESMEEELVVINLESGCYYNLNPSAAKIWAYLESGASIEAIFTAQDTNGTDPQTVKKEIDFFCQYLLHEKLMIPMEIETNLANCQAMVYTKPVIEKFTDMQEMLLLDPIHEVTEMGWPNEAKDK